MVWPIMAKGENSGCHVRHADGGKSTGCRNATASMFIAMSIPSSMPDTIAVSRGASRFARENALGKTAMGWSHEDSWEVSLVLRVLEQLRDSTQSVNFDTGDVTYGIDFAREWTIPFDKQA